MSDPRKKRPSRDKRTDAQAQADSKDHDPLKRAKARPGRERSRDFTPDSSRVNRSNRATPARSASAPQSDRSDRAQRLHDNGANSAVGDEVDQEMEDELNGLNEFDNDMPVTARVPATERNHGRGRQGNERRNVRNSRENSAPSRPNNDEVNWSEDAGDGAGVFSGRELSLQDLFYMIRERWMLGAGVGLLLSGLAAFYLLSKPKIYQAQADVQIDLAENQILDQGTGIEAVRSGVNSSYWNTEAEMQGHAERLWSTSFMSMVGGRFSAEDRRSFIAAYEKEDASLRESEDGTPVTDDEIFSSIFSSGVEIFREEESPSFSILYSHMDPEWAAETANRFASSYNDFLLQQVRDATEEANKFLVIEVDSAREKFQASQRALADFYSKRGKVFQGTDELASPEVMRVSELSQQLTQFNIEQSGLSVDLEQVDKAQGVEGLLRLSSIASFENVASIEKELAVKKRARNQLVNTGAGLKHPSMLENTTNMAALEAELKSKVEQAVQKMRNRSAALTRSKAEIEQQLEMARTALVGSGKDEGEFLVLQSQMTQDQDLLSRLEGRLKETGITSRMSMTNVHLLNAAITPVEAISPNKRLIAVGSMGLFGMCLIGLPLGLGLLDNRLKTVSELESFLQADCLGVIPLKKENAGNLALAVAQVEDTELMEAFRCIYSTIRLKTDVDYPKKILISSAVPGEGKSFVATNLAYFFEQQGKSVLIVDGDLRRPTQHKNFRLGNEAGILRWFDSNAPPPANIEDLQNADLDIRQATEADVYILRAGGADRNPTPVIETRRFAGIIESAASYFDVVIIDTPPVGVFPDALFLADYVDECVFVTKHKSVPRQKVKFALNQLQQANDRVLGVVLNQMDGNKAMSGYGYSDYGYGYGYNAKKYEAYYSQQE